uniref:Uncharacterized protein n=1 Tax=Setaria viridis TaxID=4556 RepID=A0A4U6UBI8_SETVI|nr:hypothetical protein SEVIR_5G078650v2 [Setaria viridis]
MKDDSVARWKLPSTGYALRVFDVMPRTPAGFSARCHAAEAVARTWRVSGRAVAQGSGRPCMCVRVRVLL